MRLQGRNTGLTLLSQHLSRFAFCSGEIAAPIISSLETASSQACTCTSMLLATHLAQGSLMAMMNLACMTYWKRIIDASYIDILFISGKKGELLLFLHLLLSSISVYLFDFWVWDLEMNELFPTLISCLPEIRMRKSRAQMCLLLLGGIWTSLALKLPVYLLHAKGMR